MPRTSSQLPQVVDRSADLNYRMAFVEYKDDGTRWAADEEQIKDAVALIEKSRGGDQPALTLVYVHGWKNDASGKTGDVGKFEGALKELGALTKPYPVNGIYIGWRGKTLNAPGAVSFVTFWDRNAAARRVGSQGSLTNDLNKILSAATHRRSFEDKNGARSFTIFMGHSFGSRVLESAADNSAIGKACKALHDQGDAVGAPVDLTLFLNAASSSQIFRQLNRDCSPKNGNAMVRHPLYDAAVCSADPKAKVCRPYALFTAVSSKTDLATRIVYRIARFGLTPPAQNPALRTHKQVDESAANPNETAFVFPANGKRFAIERTGRKPANHPIWIWQVEKDIIRNHGDVWNRNVMAMFAAMVDDSGMIAGPKKKVAQAGPPPVTIPRANPLPD